MSDYERKLIDGQQPPTGSANTADAMLTPEESEHYRKALEQPVCDLPAEKLPVRLTPERIAELRRIGQAATDCEVHVVQVANHFMLLDLPDYEGRNLCRYEDWDDDYPDGSVESAPQAQANAEKFAAAWNNWDALLDALAASQVEIERLRRAIESFGNNPAGFDWGVLAKIDEQEAEIERLRNQIEACSGSCRVPQV
jgi:hypothetical protein